MGIKQKLFTAGFVLSACLGGMSAPSFAAGDHLITMQQADIRAFINDVSIVTGKTFIVDPRVQGKVTISSEQSLSCLLYTSPSPRDRTRSRMPSSA